MKAVLSKNKQVQIIWFWLKYSLETLKIFTLQLKLSLKTLRPLRIHKYPNTIQLPVTYKCNFDCVMCGMRNLIHNKDFLAAELDKILCDKLFKKVKSVSFNGGEPFLKEDFYECVYAAIKELPKLKQIVIISNGYFTDMMCEKLEQIYALCVKFNVKLHLSLSIDGIGKMQDFHRGNQHAWEHMQATIIRLMDDSEKYFDSINIISTITRYNIYSISDVEVLSQKLGISVAYNIATENVRIDNYNKLEDFSVFGDEKARQMALEFFYCKFMQTKSRRYFGIYYYIKTKKRIAPCPCDNNSWVTLTPDCQLGYCATHSKELGNALENSAYEIFNGNLEYLEQLKSEHCKNCSHYIYELNREGLKKYIQELYRIHRCGGRR